MISHVMIFITALIGGALYSIGWFIYQTIDTNHVTEKFDPIKLLITMTFSAVIALILIYFHVSMGDISEWFRIIIYAGLTAITQRFSYALARKVS